MAQINPLLPTMYDPSNENLDEEEFDDPIHPRPAWQTLPTMYDLPSEDPDEEEEFDDPIHPRPAWETLPTMYDLPSEDPEEPGLPDEFHDFQPQLLRETCQTPSYPTEELFIGTDLNLYYDVRHPLWHKRPDWFLVLGVAAAQKQQDMRLSYVVWQEGVIPFLVVELLSPSTTVDDLGQRVRAAHKPPTKWQVYEQRLRIPYYVLFDRYQNQFRVFQLTATRYQELDVPAQKFWFEEIGLGLGIWQGRYQETEGLWLRWYDDKGNWINTSQEWAQQQQQLAEQEHQRAEQAEQKAMRLAEKLREMGVNPEEI
jgi:Uma2 family endonuclease